MPKKLHHRTDYRHHRGASYPSSNDALDAIAKGFRALMNQGLDIGPEAKAWVEACEHVKRTFAKPQGS